MELLQRPYSLPVLMAYYSAKTYYMNPLLEQPSGKGFADVAGMEFNFVR